METRADQILDETAVLTGRPAELAAAAAGDELPPGAAIAGYILDDIRFHGGFATVYRARPSGAGEPVAIKVLRRELSPLPSMLRRFRRESDLLARLRHPAIVEVLDAGALDDGRPYFVMEWIEGKSLAAELRARGAFSPAEALALLEPIGGALAAAHALGIIHRDVKAQNIIVPSRPGPAAKLVDFGIAKLLDSFSRAEGGKTGSTILGTPLTMAPEQILGRPVDARTDIYALGLLAYELLTGELPFRGEDLVEIEEMHLWVEPPPLSERAPVPPAFDAVVRRCLAKDPADRYPSVPDLLAALREALAAPRRPGDAPGLAILVEARLAAPDDAGDEALADVDRLLEHAREALGRIGAAPLIESADALLATLPASGEAARQRALDGALALWAELSSRPGASPEVVPRLLLHAAEPDSLRRWAPDPTGEGVFVTDDFAEGLACAAAPACDGGLRRLAS